MDQRWSARCPPGPGTVPSSCFHCGSFFDCLMWNSFVLKFLFFLHEFHMSFPLISCCDSRTGDITKATHRAVRPDGGVTDPGGGCGQVTTSRGYGSWCFLHRPPMFIGHWVWSVSVCALQQGLGLGLVFWIPSPSQKWMFPQSQPLIYVKDLVCKPCWHNHMFLVKTEFSSVFTPE